MGRKGGGIGSGRNQVVLLRRLEASKHHYKSLDEAVQYLQSTYPDYRRLRTAILTPNVSKALQQQSQRKNICKTPGKPSPAHLQFEFSEEDDDNTESSGSLMPSGKKLKRTDEREKKLIERENDHIRRRRGKQHGESTSESSDSESQSESDSDSVGGVSTSEDGIYGEKVVPEFDLMNSMLRKSYNGSKPAGVKMEENNMEVEDTSREKKLALLGGQGSGQKNSKSTVADGREPKGSEGAEMKAKEGPRFSDLGGMNAVLEGLKMEVIVPLYHPQLPTWLGVRPMAGILLHGPPGCGKTKLAHAIATETGLPFYQISATEVVSGVSGASEENIRELFSKAYRTAPSIVFIDEIDAIASKRENLQREMERRIVTQLMTCMDESHRLVKSAHKSADLEGTEDRPGYVLVIGATNRPDAVDPALRRPGRFDREIVLGVPDENGRVQILSVLIRNLRVEGTFDLLKIARMTPGFVGADLAALANKAGNIAMKRIIDQRKSELSKETVHEDHGAEWWRQPWLPEEMEKLSITMADFEEAVKMIQPSSRREGFSTTPSVKWEDVGGLDVLRQEFERYIVRRIKHPEEYEDFGVDLETGFLLYGPPGCGKTLIAKAVANEAGANFIHIKGPELLNKYVGESELAVRTIFSRARTCSPCILFFDEVDALTTKRGKEGGWVVERLLNQLLIELDGAEQRRGVYVIGATNRPEVMDRAVLRPGRFGKLLYVPLPSPEERGLILKALSRKKPLDSDVDLLAIGRSASCADLSGADLSALMNEAAMAALEEKLSYEQSSTDDKTWSIKPVHFEHALKKVPPSVSDKEKRYYEHLSHSFHAA